MIHRAALKKGTNFSSEHDLRLAERQVFEIIAEKLSVSVEEIEKIADANKGEGTCITMDHPFGKKFFIGS